ncbi:CatA-like O-acetyltransferase [Sessilibacter sp. MAH2]
MNTREVITTLPEKRLVDLNTYKRRELLEVFLQYDVPFLSATVEVDITTVRECAKNNDLNLFTCLLYCLTKTVNSIPELKHRYINNHLYEFDYIEPGYTVSQADGTFSFCDSKYVSRFERFHQTILNDIAQAKESPDTGVKDKSHMFFVSNIPWISFTHFQQPFFRPYGFNPVVTIGKHIDRDGRRYAPVALQCHHGTVDGLHIGLFFNRLEACISQFEQLIDNVEPVFD